jgi:hypothetical protein
MRDGSSDFDTYENKLEKLEKPSDAIFHKLRDHKMITQQEKEIFASYIFHMLKRVPKRIERLKEAWPDIYTSVSSEILAWLDTEEIKLSDDDAAHSAKVSAIRGEVEDVLDFYRENYLDSELTLMTMVAESHLGIPQIMANMTWQFFVAPQGYGYITGDDPVFNPGLDKSYSEISFPISTNVALIMSWYNIEQGFFETSPEVVMEVNRRTANNAQHELYYYGSEGWIVELFKVKSDGYYFIYPYSASMFNNL